MPHQLRLRSKDEYAFDTSAFLHVPKLPNQNLAWDTIEALVQADRLKTVIEVMDEIQRLDDAIYGRLRVYRDLLVYRDSLTLIPECRRIVNKYPKMCRPRAARNVADPWVIALAKTLGLVVVSGEETASEMGKKMPDVCKAENLKHYSLAQFLKAERTSNV